MANAIDDARILYSAIDLDSEDERAFEDALRELSLVLRQEPLGIDVPVARLEGKLRKEVLGILQPCDDLMTRIADLSEFLSDRFQRWTCTLLVQRRMSSHKRPCGIIPMLCGVQHMVRSG